MAVASAGPYANLHIAPDRQPHQHPTPLLTSRMPFLPPNQQRQSTEGTYEKQNTKNNIHLADQKLIKIYSYQTTNKQRQMSSRNNICLVVLQSYVLTMFLLSMFANVK